MVAWIARGLLVAAGSVTSWFVANDAPNFGLVQIAVGLLLLSLVVSVIAFWPSSWTVKFNRFGRRIKEFGDSSSPEASSCNPAPKEAKHASYNLGRLVDLRCMCFACALGSLRSRPCRHGYC